MLGKRRRIDEQSDEVCGWNVRYGRYNFEVYYASSYVFTRASRSGLLIVTRVWFECSIGKVSCHGCFFVLLLLFVFFPWFFVIVFFIGVSLLACVSYGLLRRQEKHSTACVVMFPRKRSTFTIQLTIHIYLSSSEVFLLWRRAKKSDSRFRLNLASFFFPNASGCIYLHVSCLFHSLFLI